MTPYIRGPTKHIVTYLIAEVLEGVPIQEGIRLVRHQASVNRVVGHLARTRVSGSRGTEVVLVASLQGRAWF